MDNILFDRITALKFQFESISSNPLFILRKICSTLYSIDRLSLDYIKNMMKNYKNLYGLYNIDDLAIDGVINTINNYSYYSFYTFQPIQQPEQEDIPLVLKQDSLDKIIATKFCKLGDNIKK